MIQITTLNELSSLRKGISSGLFRFISDRIHMLSQIYCANELLSLAQFCLAEYGAIYLVQAYDEIDGLIFESFEKLVLDDSIIYIAQHLSNNEYCADYIIPQNILSIQQIKGIEEEL